MSQRICTLDIDAVQGRVMAILADLRLSVEVSSGSYYQSAVSMMSTASGAIPRELADLQRELTRRGIASSL